MSGRGPEFRSRVNKAIQKSQTRRLRNLKGDLFNGMKISTIISELQKTPASKEKLYKIDLTLGYIKNKIKLSNTYSSNNSLLNMYIQTLIDMKNLTKLKISTPSINTSPGFSQQTEVASENENQDGGKRRKTRKIRKIRR